MFVVDITHFSALPRNSTSLAIIPLLRERERGRESVC